MAGLPRVAAESIQPPESGWLPLAGLLEAAVTTLSPRPARQPAPRATAVAFDGRRLTYAELSARANQLANHLLELGVGPEVMVGICVERGIEMVVGILGILKAGGVYLPIDADYL